MSVQAILAPIFVQVLLVLALGIWMARARMAAVKAGEVRSGPGSPRTYGWPEGAQRVSDCFHNQLEMPVLFYVVVTLALVTKQADLPFVALSWAFVVTRYLHAFEHTMRNRAKSRFTLFVAGFFVLAALWIYFGVKLFIVR